MGQGGNCATDADVVSSPALQALQQEIESRSRLVKSLLRQCEALCTGGPPDSAEDPRQTTEGDRGPPGGGDGARGDRRPTPFFPNDAQRIRRVASNLEKRWHALWLRSLEWQCLLEQLLHGSQVVSQSLHYSLEAAASR